MPIYEYVCSSCGEKSQRLQKPGEDSTGSRCLTCKNGELKKVLSGFSTGVALHGVRVEECGGSKRFT